VKNESERFLKQCLESLHRQDFPEHFEILVVEGGTRSQARNLGIKQARSDYVAFIDSDCIAPKSWLSALFKEIDSRPEVAGVGGLGVSPPNGALLSKSINSIFSTMLGSLGQASVSSNIKNGKIREVSGLSCHNSLFRQNVLADVEGFNDSFETNEDTNICYKLTAKGNKLLLIPEAFVWHRRRSTLKSFIKHFFTYGIGRTRSIMTDSAYLDKRILLFFIMPLALVLLWSINGLSAALVLVVYVAILFYYGLKFSLDTKDPRYLYSIPLLFGLEHSSYWFGLVYGLTKGPWKLTAENADDKPRLAKRILLKNLSLAKTTPTVYT
jgi:GT2 family glycosyltransferase